MTYNILEYALNFAVKSNPKSTRINSCLLFNCTGEVTYQFELNEWMNVMENRKGSRQSWTELETIDA